MGRPRSAGFDVTDRLGGGAADDAGVAVAQVDGQGRVGHRDGDGLVAVGAAECDFLPTDHDHAGVGGPPLDPDGLDLRAGWRVGCRAAGRPAPV